MAKKKRGFTRCLSALLAVGMLTGITPTAAFAVELPEAPAVYNTPETAPDNTIPSPSAQPDAAADEGAVPEFTAYTLYNATAVAAAGPNVAVAKLVTESDASATVFGYGILTGAGDEFDTVCWDKGENNKGCDDTNANDIVRTFDDVTYKVSTTLEDLQPGVQNLVYEFTLPQDNDLTMREVTDIVEFERIDNQDNTVTYRYVVAFDPKTDTTGEVIRTFPVHVGNKKQGASFMPEIRVYPQANPESGKNVENVETVYVTAAPAFNIVLDKNTTLDTSPSVVDFHTSKQVDRFLANATERGYTDGKVAGYKQFYGFGLEMAQTDRGIKGCEFPDLTKDITFDIDISSYTLEGQNVSDLFPPILFEQNPNIPGRANVSAVPYTEPKTDSKGRQWGCYNSGNVTLTQEGTTLHVKISGIDIDPTAFPQMHGNNPEGTGEAYWADVNKILHGFFSSYQFTIVYPSVTASGTKLEDVYPEGGTINVAATAKNMSITTTSNTTITQETNEEDNTATRSWPMTPGGSRMHQIMYSSRSNWSNGYSDGSAKDDSDVAAAGADNLAFTAMYSQDNVSPDLYPQTSPVKVEQLVLFDSTAIQNVSFGSSNAAAEGYTVKMLYAKYNKGSHLDNESMRTASKDTDFTYTDTMPEDGCDGVLLMYEGSAAKSRMDLFTQCHAQVAPTSEVLDKVYMITIITDAYTAEGYADLDRIDNRSYYTVPTYNHGRYTVDETHRFNRSSADGLYIVPYTAKITKTVANQLKKPDGTEETRLTYKVSSGERYVEYCIAPYLNYWADVTPPENSTTTVTLTDTLPQGLAYLDGSAHWGGTYTDNYTATAAGLITGGTVIDPTITPNDDGTTTLVWTIENVPLKRELPKLYYGCKVGDELYPDNDVAADKPLTNHIGIQTTEDQRPMTIANENYSSATITPTKDSAFFLSKSGGPWMELNDTSYYDLTISNTSGNAKTDLIVVDAMPYDAPDADKLTLKGRYELTSLTLNHKAIRNARDFALWYTTDPRYCGQKALGLDRSAITEANGWKKADWTTDGETVTFTGLEGIWPTAIVYLDDSLEAGTVARLHVEFKVTGEKDDYLLNTMTSPSNGTNMTATAETRIVSRSLEGIVWFDENKDGKIGEKEERLEGVTATLLRWNEETGEWEEASLFTKPDSTPYPSTVQTDEDGHYKFDGLPEGKYRVKFTSGDGTDLGEYNAETTFNQGDVTESSKVQNNTDSVKKDDDKLVSGTITDIEEAPKLEEIESGQYKGSWQTKNDIDYNMPNQNFGVIKKALTPEPTPDIPVTPKPTPDTPVTPKPTPDVPVTPKPTPDTPVTPKPTPDTPVTPEPTPDTPVTPKPTPDVPVTPEPTPDTPVTPKPTPDVPEAPTPTPAIPGAPTPKPDTPNVPASTPKPEKSNTPTTPQVPVQTPAPATAAIPQTSDSLPVALLAALAAVSLAGAAALTIVKRRRQK